MIIKDKGKTFCLKIRIFVPQNKFMNREMLYNDLSGFFSYALFLVKVQKDFY